MKREETLSNPCLEGLEPRLLLSETLASVVDPHAVHEVNPPAPKGRQDSSPRRKPWVRGPTPPPFPSPVRAQEIRSGLSRLRSVAGPVQAGSRTPAPNSQGQILSPRCPLTRAKGPGLNPSGQRP